MGIGHEAHCIQIHSNVQIDAQQGGECKPPGTCSNSWSSSGLHSSKLDDQRQRLQHITQKWNCGEVVQVWAPKHVESFQAERRRCIRKATSALTVLAIQEASRTRINSGHARDDSECLQSHAQK